MQSPIRSIVVFDTETSGLSADKNQLLEIACCPIDIDLNNLKEYESGIMKPYDNREINQGALNANGITMQQIERGRDQREVFEEFCDFMSKLSSGRNKPILCGHNILSFDIPFLQNWFSMNKSDLSKFVNLDCSIDTMWWARIKWVESTNFKLGTCCENCNIELNDAHRALFDTRANRDLVKDFIRSLRSDKRGEGDKEYVRPRFQF
jgi:DNA polymerase-3 subunit alpha (Gram-positive type)